MLLCLCSGSINAAATQTCGVPHTGAIRYKTRFASGLLPWAGRMPTPQCQSISCGVGASRQNAHPTMPINFLWGGRAECPPHNANQFLVGWAQAGRMPTPQCQSISCGVGASRQNAHPTMPINFLWGGRKQAECPPHKANQFLVGWAQAGRMPTPQCQSISCGVGVPPALGIVVI